MMPELAQRGIFQFAFATAAFPSGLKNAFKVSHETLAKQLLPI
jgi:hypothetical protein